MYVDERVVKKYAFYYNYAEALIDWCKVFNHHHHQTSNPLEKQSKFMIIGKAAGKDIMIIAR
jgi:hypothetical protein